MKALKIGAKLLLAGLIIWLVRDRFDLRLFMNLARAPLLMLVVPAAWLLNQVLTTLRLHALLGAVQSTARLSDTFRACMSSLFVANLVPGIIGGDVVKFYYLRRGDQSLTRFKLAMIVAIDRILGLVSVLLWASGLAVFVYFYKGIPSSRSAHILFMLPFIVLIGMVAALVFAYQCAHFATSWRLPPAVQRLAHEYRSLASSIFGPRMIQIMTYNLLAVLVLIVGLACVGAHLHSTTAGGAMMLEQMYLIPVAIVASTIPLTPMGIGIAQVSLAGAYGIFALDSSVGIAVSTVNQFSLLFVSILLGGYYFFKGRRSSVDSISVEDQSPNFPQSAGSFATTTRIDSDRSRYS